MNGAALETPIRRVLDALCDSVHKAGDGWKARCPGHDDRNASLSITSVRDGTVLMKCHAGCTVEAICAGAGLTVKDLFPPRENHNGHSGKARKIVATYDYRDEFGESLYQKVRYEPKGFNQRRPNGNGGWIYNLDGVKRVTFHLPELLNANENDPGGWRIFGEGEKDVLRLGAEGFTAFCNVEGAGEGKSKWRPEYNPPLAGCKLALIADKDPAGRAHALGIAESNYPTAAEIRILELPGDDVKDASDWFDAGGTAEQLQQLIEAAPAWKPGATSKAIEQNASENRMHAIEPARILPALVAMSAADLCASYKELKPPVIDGLLRETETANLVSTSKANKTHTAIDLALCICTGRMWLGRFAVRPGRVLYIDAELHRNTFAYRLAKVAKARGILADEFGDKLDVLTLRGDLRDLFLLESFFRSIPKGFYKIIIIDALYRLMPRGFDENSNADITALYNQIDKYAELTGAAIVCVHHATKGSQSGKSPTEVGSGGGAQSRAVDAHIIMRAHSEDDCVVLEAALRSFPPLPPIGLRWQYPVFSIDGSLNTDKLREPGQRKKDAGEPWTAERFASKFVTTDAASRNVVLAKARAAAVSKRESEDLFALAVNAGVIVAQKDPEDTRKIGYVLKGVIQ